MPMCLKQEEIDRLRTEGAPSLASLRPRDDRGLRVGRASEGARCEHPPLVNLSCDERLETSASQRPPRLETSRRCYVLVPPNSGPGDEIDFVLEDHLCPIRLPPGATPGAYLELLIDHADEATECVDPLRRHHDNAAVSLRVTDLVRKGKSAYESWKLQDALGFFTAGLELNPQHAVLYNNRSACYLRLGMSSNALSDAVKCISVEPSWWKGWLRKGEALYNLHDLDAAIEAVQRGIWLEPNSQELSLIMEQLQREATTLRRDMTSAGRAPLPAARSPSGDTPRVSPDEFDVTDSDSEEHQCEGILSAQEYREKGNVAHLESRVRTAIHFFSIGLCLSPYDSVLLNNRAKCFYDTGDFQQSLMDAEMCVAARPDWFRGWLRAALAMIKLNMLSAARDSIKQGFCAQPGNIELQDALHLLNEHTSKCKSSSASPVPGIAGLVFHEQPSGETSIDASFCLSPEAPHMARQDEDDRLKMEERILDPTDEQRRVNGARAHGTADEDAGLELDAPHQDYQNTVDILDKAATIARQRFDTIFDKPVYTLANPPAPADSDQDGDLREFSEDC